MREIEIKVQVKDLESLQGALIQKGIKLSTPKKQRDIVYCLPGSGDDALNANWLRIRTENDTKVTFNLKRAVVGQLDSIEHETIIDSAQEMTEIIKLLGYELYSDLTKTRRTGNYQGIEICVDNLETLGDFIEAEKLMDNDADHDKVVDELWKLLLSLGLSKDDAIDIGYDVLERKKRGL